MIAETHHGLPRVRNQLTEFTIEGFFHWTFLKYGIPFNPGNSSKSLALKRKVIAVFKIFKTCHVVVASLLYTEYRFTPKRELSAGAMLKFHRADRDRGAD